MRRDEHTLYYSKPADNWQEALPLGNGSLGAMVFGGIAQEHYALNYDQLWTGYPDLHKVENAEDAIRRSREAAMRGDYHLATTILESELSTCSSNSYQPMGDLFFTFRQSRAAVTDFCRTLDLTSACSTVCYTVGDSTYERESFTSHPDRVLAIRFTAKNAPLSFDCRPSSPLRHTVEWEGDTLLLKGECMSSSEFNRKRHPELSLTEYMENEEEKGICFAAAIGVRTDGSISREKDSFTVTDATYAEIYLTCESSFNGFDKHPRFSGKAYLRPAMDALKAAMAFSYDSLRERHLADYTPYYLRTSLTLGGEDKSHIPTDERLYLMKEGASDPALYCLLFHYGRYLTIAASRAGTQPMNLQGIWNDLLTPPWHSNYTTNINLEMNYYPTLMCNLKEMTEPLTVMAEELAVSGSKTARTMYGARGWVVHHNTDLWRETSPADGSARWFYFPHCQGWLCHHLFDYYEYTLDKDYLKNRAFPLMKSAAEFYLDMLTEDRDGYLVMSPATSPENVFRSGEEVCSVSVTSTMAMSFIKELFENLLSASEVLAIEDKTVKDVKDALPRLLPFRTGKQGDLLEYYEDHEQVEETHRHISHLYALHPARLITPMRTPELMDACRRTLDRRGDDGTGWSLGWKINFHARMKNGNRALKLIKMQLSPVEGGARSVHMNHGGTYPNLFDAHPPFQIDGNFGASSGIGEMLLYSEFGMIELLPALPDEWQSGSITGICARGNLTLDIQWENGELSGFTVYGDPTGVRFVWKGRDVTDLMKRA